MGCDACYTNHAECDQNDMENLEMLLATAGVNYLMGIPAGDDVMLNYETTSFHNNAALREILRTSPAPEFEAWLERLGLWRDGRLTDKAGDASQFLRRDDHTGRIYPPAAEERMSADDAGVQRIVDEVMRRLGERATVATPSATPCDGEQGHACTAAPRPVHAVEHPAIAAVLPALVALTSSQIAMGRAGNRFRTDDCLRAREGHADARDAVHSEVPEGWAGQHGLLALQTRCKDRHEYLLFPNQGRQLDEASSAAVQAEASQAPDVQLIVGDGLSPSAIVENGELDSACAAARVRGGWLADRRRLLREVRAHRGGRSDRRIDQGAGLGDSGRGAAGAGNR